MFKDTEAIILSAGYSSRLEEFKPLVNLYGIPIILWTMMPLMELCEKIIVVCGYNHEELEELLYRFPGIEPVFNKDFEKGMFSSVKEGIKHIEKDYFFLVPGDMPLINKKTYSKLYKEKNNIVIPEYKGRHGHPILMKSDNVKKLSALENNSILKEYILSNEFKTVQVDDEGVLFDVDTQEDIIYFENKLNKVK